MDFKASQITLAALSAADRLASSADPQIGTPTYDDHGNITQLAGNGTPIQFTYDASDQNTKIQQGTNWTEYVKSASGSVLIKREYRNSTLNKVYRNAGGVLPTCSISNQNSCSTLDKYVSLPGGVSLTLKGAGATPIYSVKNSHGDTAIQVAATGLPSTNVMLYDPFGQVLASNTFGTGNGSLANASDNPMGWAADPGRKAESMFSIPIVEMGARVYLPTLGRFLQVDPVEGGGENAYSYANDPINQNDYSGQFVIALPIIAVALVQAVIVTACVIGAAYAVWSTYTYINNIVKNAQTNTDTQSQAQTKTKEDDKKKPVGGVYTFRDKQNGGKLYIGKTVDLQRRESEHTLAERIIPGTWQSYEMAGARPDEIRAKEQNMINAYMVSQGYRPGIDRPCYALGNKINSIAPKYWSDKNIEGAEFGPFANYGDPCS